MTLVIYTETSSVFENLMIVSIREKMEGTYMELVFEITQEDDGGYTAECLSEDIFTQADNWSELRKNVQEAVDAYYFDSKDHPASVRLHLIRDEVVFCS